MTIAAGSETVPVGSYTRKVLAKLPPEQEQAILDNIKSNEPDVAGVVGKVVAGRRRCRVRLHHGRQGRKRQAAGGLDSRRPPADRRLWRGGGQGHEAPRSGVPVRPGPHERLRSGRPARRRLRAAAEELSRPGGVLFRALLIVALALVVGFLFLPVLAIFVDVGLGELISSIGDPVAVDALKLSLLTTGIALGIILRGRDARRLVPRPREFRGARRS